MFLEGLTEVPLLSADQACSTLLAGLSNRQARRHFSSQCCARSVHVLCEGACICRCDPHG